MWIYTCQLKISNYEKTIIGREPYYWCLKKIPIGNLKYRQTCTTIECTIQKLNSNVARACVICSCDHRLRCNSLLSRPIVAGWPLSVTTDRNGLRSGRVLFVVLFRVWNTVHTKIYTEFFSPFSLRWVRVIRCNFAVNILPKGFRATLNCFADEFCHRKVQRQKNIVVSVRPTASRPVHRPDRQRGLPRVSVHPFSSIVRLGTIRLTPGCAWSIVGLHRSWKVLSGLIPRYRTP